MAISVGKLGRSSAGSVGYRVGVDSIGDAEREAFERLYREFLPRVAGYVRRHIHDYELVDEIVQETLLRAYRHGLHREAGDEHWRWLSTVARNLCIDQRALHRNWRESSVEEPETLDLTIYESDPEAQVVAAERQEIVARVLAQLSERERRLLVQKHIEGRRVREMANLEGVHVEALKSALRRARRSFHESYVTITDKTGVASVFGPIAAAAGLRLRGLKARIAATGDQVATLAAHVTTSSGFLHTVTTAAVVVGLALGPGLGVLGADGSGEGAGGGRGSAEAVLDGTGRGRGATLASSINGSSFGLSGGDAPSGVSGRSGWGAIEGSGGSGADDGGADDPPGDSSSTSPIDPLTPGDTRPKVEPFDAGDGDVEEPEDATFVDFAHASGSSSSGGSRSDAEASGDAPGGETASAEEQSPNESGAGSAGESEGSEPRDGSRDEPAEADEPADEGSDGDSEATDDGESEATDEDTDDGETKATDDEPDDEADARESQSGDESGSGEAQPRSAPEDDGRSERPDREADSAPEIFALGVPAFGKWGDCRIQCSVLFHSTDGGASWEKLGAKGLEARRLLLNPDYPDDPRLYAYGRLGLMASTDGGETFWPIPGTSMGTGLAGFSADLWPGWSDGREWIVLGNMEGVFLHDTLTGATRPLTLHVRAESVVPVTEGAEGPGMLVAGFKPNLMLDPQLLFCNQLGCDERAELPREYRHARVHGNGFGDGSKPLIYARGAGVLETADNGRSYAEATHLPAVHMAGHGDRVYAIDGFDLTLHVSDDGGQTWVQEGFVPRNPLAMLTLPGNRLLVGGDEASPSGLSCSPDGGATWGRRCPPAPVGAGGATTR